MNFVQGIEWRIQDYRLTTRPNSRQIQRILLARPRLVSDHFYSAISITFPNINEAEDSGHLKYMLRFKDNPMSFVLI